LGISGKILNFDIFPTQKVGAVGGGCIAAKGLPMVGADGAANAPHKKTEMMIGVLASRKMHGFSCWVNHAPKMETSIEKKGGKYL